MCPVSLFWITKINGWSATNVKTGGGFGSTLVNPTPIAVTAAASVPSSFTST